MKILPILTTRSGREVSVVDPQPESFDISDVANALSKICRFGGHCDRFYSVAEHSILMAEFAIKHWRDYSFALFALMHDASEAYLMDLPRPLKVQLERYMELEAQMSDVLMSVLAPELTLAYREIKKLDLKSLDNAMLIAETRQLGIATTSEVWEPFWDTKPLPVTLKFFVHHEARIRFKELYFELLTKLNPIFHQKHTGGCEGDCKCHDKKESSADVGAQGKESYWR